MIFSFLKLKNTLAKSEGGNTIFIENSCTEQLCYKKRHNKDQRKAAFTKMLAHTIICIRSWNKMKRNLLKS